MKTGAHRNEAIRKAARGQMCTLRLPGICHGRTETVVWCHSPYQEDGKGVGRKAHDMFGCFGCAECHDALDGRRLTGMSKDEIRDRFHQAMKRSWLVLWRLGVRLW